MKQFNYKRKRSRKAKKWFTMLGRGLCCSILLMVVASEIFFYVWFYNEEKNRKIEEDILANSHKVEVESEIDSKKEIDQEIVDSTVYCVIVKKLSVFVGNEISQNEIGSQFDELHMGEQITLIVEGTPYSLVKTMDGREGYVWSDGILPAKEYNDKTAAQKCVLIDAGHQGSGNTDQEPEGPGMTKMQDKVTSGTRGVSTSIEEHKLNLEISLQLEKVLKERGYTVVMVRRTADIDISNKERAMLANQIEADIFIRIHADGSEDQSASGAMAICSTEDSPFEVGKYYQDSRRLADSILDEYTNATGFIKRKVMESDSYAGINWCTGPVIILEMGFMSNPKEDVLMQDAFFQEKMVTGIVNGIDKYFGESYVE